MSHNKKYYWLKLMKDFFIQAKIKKLRKLAGGDTYVIIYLKMMLLSINSDGIVVFESIEPTLEEELALVLDEDVDHVKFLIAFLVANNLIEQKSESDFFMVEVSSLIGSETTSAERVRKHREKKKMLHCNTTVTEVKLIETKCNTEKSREEIDTTTNYIEINKNKALEIFNAYFPNSNREEFYYEFKKFHAENPLDTNKPATVGTRTQKNWQRWCIQLQKFNKQWS